MGRTAMTLQARQAVTDRRDGQQSSEDGPRLPQSEFARRVQGGTVNIAPDDRRDGRVAPAIRGTELAQSGQRCGHEDGTGAAGRRPPSASPVVVPTGAGKGWRRRPIPSRPRPLPAPTPQPRAWGGRAKVSTSVARPKSRVRRRRRDIAPPPPMQICSGSPLAQISTSKLMPLKRFATRRSALGTWT